MYSLHLARTHTTSSDRQTSPDVGVANSQEKTTRTPYSQDTTRERRLLMSCASHLQHCHNVSKKGNMCDEEIDQQLSPRLYHRALDVSLFLSPLNEETDITSTRKINTADSCACHCGKIVTSLILYMALTSFATFTPVAKMVRVPVRRSS